MPAERQIRGLGPVRLAVAEPERTAAVLVEVLGMAPVRRFETEAGPVEVFSMGEGGAGAELQLLADRSAPSRQGAGAVHHVAFSVPDADYGAWAERLRALVATRLVASEHGEIAYTVSAGVRWVGDKIEARRIAESVGAPLVAGTPGPVASAADAAAQLVEALPDGLDVAVTGPAGFTADLAAGFAGIDGILLLVALAAYILTFLGVVAPVVGMVLALLPLTGVPVSSTALIGAAPTCTATSASEQLVGSAISQIR